MFTVSESQRLSIQCKHKARLLQDSQLEVHDFLDHANLFDFREATAAENDDVFDAIESGALQITEHGPTGLCQRWSHDMPTTVHHQATGRAIPGTAAAARQARIAEEAVQ